MKIDVLLSLVTNKLPRKVRLRDDAPMVQRRLDAGEVISGEHLILRSMVYSHPDRGEIRNCWIDGCGGRGGFATR